MFMLVFLHSNFLVLVAMAICFNLSGGSEWLLVCTFVLVFSIFNLFFCFFSIIYLGIDFVTVIVGEIANFVAYMYAPAVLVTPLGALSIIVR
jgi:hypothetical protein